MKQTKYFVPIVMMLMALTTLSTVIGYQLIQYKHYVFSAVVLIIPFRYLICDIISEVYGFQIAKKIVVYFIVFSFLFALLAWLLIKLPSPAYWTHRSDYNFVLGNALSIVSYSAIAVFIGSVCNIYLVSKWKSLVKGKYFWFRSWAGSCMGELLQYVIALTLMFHGVIHFNKLLALIFTDYAIQAAMLLVLAPVAHFAMFWLKQKENIKDNYFVKADPY